MCDVCVVNAVQDRMLSRRNLFGGSAAVGAALAQVPAAGATLVVGAPKHRGGPGGPARIFAMV